MYWCYLWSCASLMQLSKRLTLLVINVDVGWNSEPLFFLEHYYSFVLINRGSSDNEDLSNENKSSVSLCNSCALTVSQECRFFIFHVNVSKKDGEYHYCHVSVHQSDIARKMWPSPVSCAAEQSPSFVFAKTILCYSVSTPKHRSVPGAFLSPHGTTTTQTQTTMQIPETVYR